MHTFTIEQKQELAMAEAAGVRVYSLSYNPSSFTPPNAPELSVTDAGLDEFFRDEHNGLSQVIFTTVPYGSGASTSDFNEFLLFGTGTGGAFDSTVPVNSFLLMGI